MSVWLVIQGDLFGSSVLGVYSTKRAAVAHARELDGRRPRWVTVAEWAVDSQQPVVEYDKRGQRGVRR